MTEEQPGSPDTPCLDNGHKALLRHRLVQSHPALVQLVDADETGADCDKDQKACQLVVLLIGDEDDFCKLQQIRNSNSKGLAVSGDQLHQIWTLPHQHFPES